MRWVSIVRRSLKSRSLRLASRSWFRRGSIPLPPPGSGKVEQPTLADIQDPDAKKQVSQSALEKQQADYCKVHYEDAKASGDSSAVSAVGPLGPCHASIFSAIAKWTKPKEETGDEDLVSQ